MTAMTSRHTPAIDVKPKTARVLMLDVTPSQANTWFEVFSVVLFCGMFAVAAGMYGVIRMGEVKQRFSDERLADSETLTAQAKTEAAQANERIASLRRDAALANVRVAELEKGVAEANARAAEAQLALERLKAPRWIGSDVEQRLVARLRQFPGTSATLWLWRGSSSEAGEFTTRLRTVLSAAHWQVTGVNSFFGRRVGTGTIIAIREEPNASDEAAARALLEELQSMAIPSEIKRAVTDDPASALGAFVGKAASPSANVWIIVGSKP
jgi:hypothetical protein